MRLSTVLSFSIYRIYLLCVYISFSLLWGPLNHLRHLFTGDRLFFTIPYFCAIFATLYTSLWVRTYFYYEIFCWTFFSAVPATCLRVMISLLFFLIILPHRTHTPLQLLLLSWVMKDCL